MGNCLFGGLGGEGGGFGGGVIKIIASNGGIMEFSGPITAGCITNEFPGHAIFPSHDLFWRPLSTNEDLIAGNSYYLLPLKNTKIGGQIVREGHVRSKSIPTSTLITPYRMSFDYQGVLKRSYTEAFSSTRYYNNCNNYNNNGFWKVKLVISTDQLLQILSQENQTQELIENMRAVAKCGNGISSSSSSSSSAAAAVAGGGFSSDQWSVSSSRNGSSSSKKLDGLLLDI